ncbi:hypothetical protein HIM_04685 [Hirsutella minnesotensis 3608]|uniref:Dehydrogenase FUB6 n=1 Tax=Hirsutella minnesotensis 3608 TaxID=1043627 RepID=A0A0F7ZL10_9HYPO|nr:hypothetical protein HIM_04685 [Hirsutella minnesotensis 3608]
MAPNKSLIYKQIPSGLPVPGQDLVIETRDIDLDNAPQGGLIVEVLYASFDPYLRGRMRDPKIKSYVPAFEPDQPVTNNTVSRVVKSGSPDFNEGDLVIGHTAIAEYARIEKAAPPLINKIHNSNDLDLGLFLGPLGMPGLTAWSGLHKIGRPKKGETIFISSAAGAVGQIVGQIAKREGLTVLGSVGSDDKLDFITNELGFDGGFNYKKEKPLDALRRLAPQGIDIYFENVGGEHLEAVLDVMNTDGRIVACGMISDYNVAPAKRRGIQNMVNIVSQQITMQGFIVSKPDYGPAYAKEHQEKLQAWLADGSVKAKLSVTEGIDKAADAFVGMLRGENFGKAVLKIKGGRDGSKI